MNIGNILNNPKRPISHFVLAGLAAYGMKWYFDEQKTEAKLNQ